MFVKYFFYFISFFLYIHQIYGVAKQSDKENSNNNQFYKEWGTQYEIFPNAIINNSVNVITGEYCDSEIDLEVPGIANLYFERALENKKQQLTYLKGWTINLLREAKFDDKTNILTLTNGNDSKVEFRPLATYERPMTVRIGVDRDRLKYYFINAATSLSGRTNKKNEFAQLNAASKYLKTIGANYDRTDFNGLNLAARTLHANRLQTIYHYEEKYLKRAEVVNPLNEVISSINLSRPKDEKFIKNPVITINGDGNSNVKYSFSKKKKSDHMAFVLEEVTGNRIPQTIFEHTFINDKLTEARISKKVVGGRNYLQNVYFDKGTHKLVNNVVKLSNPEDFRYGRVKAQLEPVGRNANPVCTYRFEYEDLGDESGMTYVHDAYKNTLY